MYVRRNISTRLILKFAWRNLLFFTAWSFGITWFYLFFLPHGIQISLPFLPLSTIGIAVAFYVGFKNSQSYDRLWEARKLWGGIVNASRSWSNQILSYLSQVEACEASEKNPGELYELRQRLVYRQLAWINTLRIQLRRTTIFDRHNLIYVPDLRIQRDKDCDHDILPFLPPDEYETIMTKSNSAAQLLHLQGLEIGRCRDAGLLNDFRHMDLMNSLDTLYELQGGCERIKNTPFPRQYAYFSSVFVWIFCLLLPFGLVGEFARIHANDLIWLNVPFTVLIAWIFLTIDIVGDNSEDPFENYINDVPMTAICRNIEIDLREMLGETELPEKIQPVDGILL